MYEDDDYESLWPPQEDSSWEEDVSQCANCGEMKPCLPNGLCKSCVKEIMRKGR